MGQLKTTIDFQFRRYFNNNSAVKRKCFLRSIGTVMIVVINSLQLAENSAKTRKSDPDHRSSQTPRITLLQSFRKIKKFYFTVCLKRYTIRYGIILHVSVKSLSRSKKVIAWPDQLIYFKWDCFRKFIYYSYHYISYIIKFDFSYHF